MRTAAGLPKRYPPVGYQPLYQSGYAAGFHEQIKTVTTKRKMGCHILNVAPHFACTYFLLSPSAGLSQFGTKFGLFFGTWI